MLIAYTLFTLPAIAAGTGAEASEGATQTFEKIIRRSTPSDAVTRLVVERDIPITYDYISTLLRIPNAFGEGAACVVCHSSNDPDKAYRGLNLSTCEGIIRGAMEAPVRGPTVAPGHPENSLILRFLRKIGCRRASTPAKPGIIPTCVYWSVGSSRGRGAIKKGLNSEQNQWPV